MVEPPTRPRPIWFYLRVFSLHIFKFFQPLGFVPDVEVVKTPLPISVRGLIVNGFRQDDPIEHPAAPRLFTTLQALSNAPSRPLFQTTDDARGAMSFAGQDEQMKVPRHQDVAHQPASQTQLSTGLKFQ